MSIIVMIDGCKAIPVRALPWLTGWHFGADDVAEAFARETDDPSFASIHAFRRRSDGDVAPVARREWERVVHALEDTVDLALPRRQWEAEATRSLPAGIFVWLSEWRAAYNRCADGPVH